MSPLHIVIIGLSVFCVITTLFILGLFIQRRRNKRTKETFRNSEERYILALAGATDGLWDWDVRSDTVSFSDRFCQILGYSPGELPNSMESFGSSAGG